MLTTNKQTKHINLTQVRQTHTNNNTLNNTSSDADKGPGYDQGPGYGHTY